VAGRVRAGTCSLCVMQDAVCDCSCSFASTSATPSECIECMPRVEQSPQWAVFETSQYLNLWYSSPQQHCQWWHLTTRPPALTAHVLAAWSLRVVLAALGFSADTVWIILVAGVIGDATDTQADRREQWLCHRQRQESTLGAATEQDQRTCITVATVVGASAWHVLQEAAFVGVAVACDKVEAACNKRHRQALRHIRRGWATLGCCTQADIALGLLNDSESPSNPEGEARWAYRHTVLSFDSLVILD
jgi:hypothetical protein